MLDRGTELVSKVKAKKGLLSWSFILSGILAVTVCITLVLNLFNPIQIGPNGILVFFVLAYLLIFLIVLSVMRLVQTFSKKYGQSTQKLVYLAAVVSFAPVMLIALSSINQLQILDIALVIVLEVLAIFYVSRRMR